jgi:NHLM bacteriocin system ABC transporter ATP-binding protein
MISNSDGIAWIKQSLGERVQAIPVQGDKPLLLDNPSCAYLTLSEHHQLFCVGYRDGKAEGRREHLAACGPGQLIFGLSPRTAADSTALMLSGVSGSVVWRVPMVALLALGEGPQRDEGARILAELFDRWITLLIAALPPAGVPNRSRPLVAGEWWRETSEQTIFGAQGIVWVAPSIPPRSYRGLDVARIGTIADAWPLSEQAWAVCAAGEFRVWTTEQLLKASGRAGFAQGFTAFVEAVVAARRAQFARDRLLRDEASRSAEAHATSATLTALSNVGSSARLREARRGGATPSLTSQSPFQLACRRIFEALELEPWPEVHPPAGAELPDLQLALSQIHGVRTRAVLLEAGFPAIDAGPLLAFYAASGGGLMPVALLPKSSGGYDCYDPSAGTTTELIASDLGFLQPNACQFYRSLPDRPLTPIGVLRFAAHGVRNDVARIFAIGLVAGLLATGLPLLTGQVFDRIIPSAERNLLWQLMGGLLAVFMASWLFDLARSFAMVRAQTRMDASLEAGTWDRLLSLPLPFFRKYAAGDLADRAAGIGAMRQVMAQVGLSSLLSGIFSIWNLALLFYYDVSLALAASALVMIAAFVATTATYFELPLSRASSELDGKLSGLSLQLLGGIAKLRSSGAESRAFGVWARSFARKRDLSLAGGRIGVRVAIFQSFYPLLCSMTLYFMIAGPTARTLTTGDFLAFSAAFTTFLLAVLELVSAALQTVKLVPLYERASPILTSPTESRGSGRAAALSGAIELSHVTFRYETPGPLVLDDLTLRIEPGEFVAIVGPSGSGKSTLLRVLLGFDAPTEGGVFYDGQALSGLDLRALRQQIGVVLQHSRIMAGDILTNIVGSSGRSLEDAWRAARLAAFDVDIDAMPMGMHTVIAQGGGTLSGGQRQRLLIARALAAQPRLLFFDEATSALDNRTQAAVSSSLDRLRVTRVVIAHRLSTIQHADRIVVLDRGRIVQQGRFENLLRQGGTFGTLARRQLA